MKGKFIVLEGPDGSGTTTHSSLLAKKLRSLGHDVLLTAEPTDSSIGRFIRKQLQEKKVDSASALQLLFCADRAWHIEKVIRPALEAGKTVISDRYVISTLVYGEAMGLDPEWLLKVNTPFVEPDILLVALPDFRLCMKRIQKRLKLDVIENMPFQRKIYDLYERITLDDKEARTIDTGGTLEEVSKKVLDWTLARC